MSKSNKHRNAEHGDRPASFNHEPAPLKSFWDAPGADLDMFTRWIKLSDELLGAKWTGRKKAANGRRGRPLAPCCA